MNPSTRSEREFVRRLDRLARIDCRIPGAFVRAAAQSSGLSPKRVIKILCELRNLQQLSLLKQGAIIMREPRRF